MELAAALGTTQRMIAYYESRAEKAPAALLPQMAAALDASADELLGIEPLKKGKKPDTQLHRRLQDASRTVSWSVHFSELDYCSDQIFCLSDAPGILLALMVMDEISPSATRKLKAKALAGAKASKAKAGGGN